MWSCPNNVSHIVCLNYVFLGLLLAFIKMSMGSHETEICRRWLRCLGFALRLTFGVLVALLLNCLHVCLLTMICSLCQLSFALSRFDLWFLHNCYPCNRMRNQCFLQILWFIFLYIISVKITLTSHNASARIIPLSARIS